MTDPQPLFDVDLLTWAIVLGYRARQQRAGLKFVLMPFPPCPTCGETVYAVNQVEREVGITRTTCLTMQPCGHAHAATDDDVYPLLRHIDNLIDRVERDDRSGDPNVHGWMVDDIAREARTLLAPPQPQDGPESGQEARGGGAERRDGDSGPQAASGGAGWTQLEVRAFNAVLPALRAAGEWLPLSARRAVANAVLAAVREHLDIGDEEAWCKTCRRVWDGPRHRCETDAEQAIARVREVLAERRREVAEREVDGILEFGTPGASWCDAVMVTCGRIDDALKIHSEPGYIHCPPDARP